MKHCFLLLALIMILVAGCETTRRPVDLTYEDFQAAALEAINDMLASKNLVKERGGRYLMAISRVDNETTQFFDPDQLLKSIQIALRKSGKVVISNLGVYGPRDPMGKAGANEPEYSISGKIIEHRQYYGRQVKADYYFQLTITDLQTGVVVWDGQTVIRK